jgi:hypothetical protein
MITGAIAQVASGRGIGETDISTLLVAIPGTLIGLAIVYVIGVRGEHRVEPVSSG